MSTISYISNVLNQKGCPAIFEDTLANRPVAGFTGRLFVSIDTLIIQRDNGIGWDTLGGGGGGGGITGNGVTNYVAFFTTPTNISSSNLLGFDILNEKVISHTSLGLSYELTNNGTVGGWFAIKNSLIPDSFEFGMLYNSALPTFFISKTGTTFFKHTNQPLNPVFGAAGRNVNNVELTGERSDPWWITQQPLVAGVTVGPSFAVAVPTQFNSGAGFLMSANYSNPTHTFNFEAVGIQAGGFSSNLNFKTSSDFSKIQVLNLDRFANSTFSGRVNVNNAVDNALFTLNNNGVLYTGGFSPTAQLVNVFPHNIPLTQTIQILEPTVASLNSTLPSALGHNNMIWLINNSTVTHVILVQPGDIMRSTTGTNVTTLSMTSNQRRLFISGGVNIWYVLTN